MQGDAKRRAGSSAAIVPVADGTLNDQRHLAGTLLLPPIDQSLDSDRGLPPPQVLERVHRRLRRGDFGKDLVEAVEANHEHWRALPTVDALRGLYVAAEVFDYFGDYPRAAELLSAAGRVGVEAFPTSPREAWKADDERLKREIWVAIAQATVLYRLERYSDARVIFDRCNDLLGAPSAPLLLGTRARLSHSQGQVWRQLHKYAEARKAFGDATHYARLRFKHKTDFAEQQALDDPPFGRNPPPLVFDDQRLLCHWTIGKCLALGLGWIDYTVGQLSSASVLLSAGYALLRATGDVVHRAYATLLIGAVARARAGDDKVRLKEAIDILRDGSNVLREHPRFTLRASYELALAYYRVPEYRRDAEKEIRFLKERFASSPTTRSARWLSSVLVIESRMMRLLNKHATARKLAEDAVKLAAQANDADAQHGDILAEAQITLGEAMLDQASALGAGTEATGLRQQAIDRFSRAAAMGRDNAKIAAICQLHLARAHGHLGDLRDAQTARETADASLRLVEHGFAHSLAESVDRDLRLRRTFFIDGRSAALNKDDNADALQAFLIQQAMLRAGNRWFELVGFTERGGTNAVARLRRRGYHFSKSKPGPR
jgi:hypothetical protein